MARIETTTSYINGLLLLTNTKTFQKFISCLIPAMQRCFYITRCYVVCICDVSIASRLLLCKNIMFLFWLVIKLVNNMSSYLFTFTKSSWYTLLFTIGKIIYRNINHDCFNAREWITRIIRNNFLNQVKQHYITFVIINSLIKLTQSLILISISTPQDHF